MNSPKKAAKKTFKNFKKTIPILLGVLLLVSLFVSIVPKSLYPEIFTGNSFFDPLIGSGFGSFATGNPLTSYIIGGELLEEGVTMVAVTAFIVSWVTVGIVQFPAESMTLGRRFAAVRNIISFLLSMLVAVFTVFLLGIV